MFEEFGNTLVIEPYLANVVLAGSVLDNSNFSRKVELGERQKLLVGSRHWHSGRNTLGHASGRDPVDTID